MRLKLPNDVSDVSSELADACVPSTVRLNPPGGRPFIEIPVPPPEPLTSTPVPTLRRLVQSRRASGISRTSMVPCEINCSALTVLTSGFSAVTVTFSLSEPISRAYVRRTLRPAVSSMPDSVCSLKPLAVIVRL